jgi:hypothetical protein
MDGSVPGFPSILARAAWFFQDIRSPIQPCLFVVFRIGHSIHSVHLKVSRYEIRYSITANVCSLLVACTCNCCKHHTQVFRNHDLVYTEGIFITIRSIYCSRYHIKMPGIRFLLTVILPKALLSLFAGCDTWRISDAIVRPVSAGVDEVCSFQKVV